MTTERTFHRVSDERVPQDKARIRIANVFYLCYKSICSLPFSTCFRGEREIENRATAKVVDVKRLKEGTLLMLD
jgi:hypothetical protein